LISMTKAIYPYFTKPIKFLAIIFIFPFHAQATNNFIFECTFPGSPVAGFNFQAGESMKIPLTGTCTAIRNISRSAHLNLQITPLSGDNPARISVLDTWSNTYMAQLPLGDIGPSCLGGPCVPIPLRRIINYTHYIVGTAPLTPGRRSVQISLGVTDYSNPRTYNQWINYFTFTYNVPATSCKIINPNFNMNFGTINTVDISNQRSLDVEIAVNCPSAARAEVTLVPTQPIVSANRGLSRTSLDGLNMRTTWTSTTAAVNLNTPIKTGFTPGYNYISLSFTPELSAGQLPNGPFASNYTMIINYL